MSNEQQREPSGRFPDLPPAPAVAAAVIQPAPSVASPRRDADSTAAIAGPL